MQIILRRVASSDAGTFGVLVENDVPISTTCEDPWNDNARNISCIPAGTYEFARHDGSKFKDVWQILNVPGRSGILIHNGNNIDHTQGCILVGSGFDLRGARPAVTSSKDALNYLRDRLPDRGVIVIVDPFAENRP